VFVAVLESLPRYQGQALFRTWLSSITRNKVADFYRRRSRRPEAASLDDEATPTPATFSISEERTMVRIAVQNLPNHYQEIILLRFSEGLSFAEIAITLEISLEASKSRYRRAVAAAAQEMGLDPEGAENP
jgi:RNA polymerase sigma-70 factor (ECF subfamily)